MKKQNISIKEIARLAGTSVATVSRVINQNGRFSEETERRVREVIEAYHYRPNELARSLRVDKAGRRRIAIVLHARTMATQERRLNGYRQALYDYDIPGGEERQNSPARLRRLFDMKSKSENIRAYRTKIRIIKCL